MDLGEPRHLKTLYCDERDRVLQSSMDCEAGVYVRLDRPGADDLEGIVGLTSAWRHSEPLDAKYGRTLWAFRHCQEHN